MKINQTKLKQKLQSLIDDMNEGFESSTMAIGKFTDSSGREVEIQLNMTSEDFDFIGDDRHFVMEDV